MGKLKKIQAIALYIYFFSLNFQVFNLYGLGSPARLTGLIYLATIVPNIREFLKTDNIKPFITLIVGLWLFLTLISLFHINAYSSNVFDFTMLSNILFFWFLVNHERIHPGVLLKGVFSFALSGVVLLLFYNAGIGIEYVGGRVSIFGDNANGIALRLSMAIIILIYVVMNNNLRFKKWRFILLLPIPSMLFFMLETGSRKAVIGFVLAFIVGTLLYKTKRRSWHKMIVLILAVVVASYFIDMLMQSEVLMKRLLQTAEEGSLGGREDIWSNIIPLIQDNFVWGVGKTGYHAYMIKLTGSIVSPHNALLEIMAYTGFVGLSIYLFFLYRITWQAYKGYKKHNLLLPFLLLIPIYGLILGGQALNVKIVWAIYTFAVSSVFQTSNHKSILKY